MIAHLSLWNLGILILVVGLGWYFLREFSVRQSPTCNIPGPPTSSWLKGNLEQLFDPIAGWNFHDSLMKTYGSTSLLRGSFGVGHPFRNEYG
ncbi:hypothetical protein GYMLUDRAFT_41832 [Collybiopsis luxurians FD-317 M1]|uniref:Cytochrome P450 n=1 Tax=Collybiopsis luxurians FD-317 M1 TaxID=944289 RepID=A0A0D0BF25_9AGAR|nr:hypothetical protein GYMLUDRAFT_41832 [Collybiopsis luxurians FD-317 M1]